MGIMKNMGNLAVTIATSLVLIFLGIIYFMLTIFIIKIGASWAGYSSVNGDMVVLGTCIITAAAMIGSAIQQ